MGTSSFFFLGSIRYVISVSRVLAGGKAKCNVVVETEGRYTVPKHAGKILVTDDDQTSRESMQKVLERDGYVVEIAEDVDRALEQLRDNHFDLIVCDYRMPEKTGLDLLRELRGFDMQVPVLLVSALVDTDTEVCARHLGAVHVLRKPLCRKVLLERTAEITKS